MNVRLTLALLALGGVVSAQAPLTPPTTNYSFAWDAPTTGGPVTNYQWQVQPGAAFVSVGLATSVTLPALANGPYTAEVRACNPAAAVTGNPGGCGPTTILAFSVGPVAPPALPGATSNLRIAVIPTQGNVAAYRSHAMTTYASRATSTTVTKPVGVAAGDLLLLTFVDGHSPAPTNPITPPVGFSPLPGTPSSVVDGGGFQVDLRVFYKVASGSEPVSYVVGHPGGALATEALLVAVSGGTGVPALTIAKGTGTTSTASGLTTSVPNTLVLFVEHNWDLYSGTAVPSGTTPAFVERSDLATSLLYLATGALATPGPTGTPSHANHNGAANQPWQTLLLAVAP